MCPGLFPRGLARLCFFFSSSLSIRYAISIRGQTIRVCICSLQLKGSHTHPCFYNLHPEPFSFQPHSSPAVSLGLCNCVPCCSTSHLTFSPVTLHIPSIVDILCLFHCAWHIIAIPKILND